MLQTSQLDALLAVYPVLLDLPTPLRRELAGGSQIKIEAGRVLFDLGTPCTQLLLVTHGSLRVVKTEGSGREVLLYRVGPGELCLLTLGCLLDNTAYAAKGAAEVDVEAVSISRETFLEMLEQAASFRMFVFRLLTGRLLAFIDLVGEISFGS